MLYTIGYGNRSPDELMNILQNLHIQYLVDVRSVPQARFNTAFGQQSLRLWLAEQESVRYVFMGDLLGGRPSCTGCYDAHGKIDYQKVMQQDFFARGIERLRVAHQKNYRLALMCAETKPERCHRSKLIGVALDLANIPLWHIDEQGQVRSQAAIMQRLGFFGAL
ncbi:MAG: DUF488 family protein [Bernardetiaceae bacterium]